MTDEIINPPDVITPLESGYIRAAIAAVLPAINWIIYATNLDEVFHITKLTTNQVWQGVNALLIVVSVVQVIRKRIKDGNDPTSTAQKIVLRKPAEPKPDDFQRIVDDLAAPPEPEILKVESDPESPRLARPSKPASPGMSNADLINLIEKSERKHPAGEGQEPLP